MKRLILWSIALFLCASVPILADTFGTGANQFTIDFVPIGNPGNPADLRPGGYYGDVSYDYRIGRYEITNAQWNAFVAAAGAPTSVLPFPFHKGAVFTGDLQPTNAVSWYEALQFCNYLTSGDKSRGAYQFSGDNINPGTFLGIDRQTAKSLYGTIYVLPTVDEWYKAAYFNPISGFYSLYTNGTDVAPLQDVDSNYYNTAMSDHGTYSTPWNVGTGLQEQNGTYDMMGNVWEWNEWISGAGTSSTCGMSGGSYADDLYLGDAISTSIPIGYYGSHEIDRLGFRIASIPEPATIFLLSFGGLVLRRRKFR